MQNSKPDFPFHHSSSTRLHAAAAEALSYLDNPRKLSSHMGKSSWMMAGSKMDLRLDEKQGHGMGAEIILDGSMLGLPLFVREFVTESRAPSRKVWETRGPQKLIIMDQYRMGFEITPDGPTECTLQVTIDYSLPSKGLGRLLGPIFGSTYARWCTNQMVKDAVSHFNSNHQKAK